MSSVQIDSMTNTSSSYNTTRGDKRSSFHEGPILPWCLGRSSVSLAGYPLEAVPDVTGVEHAGGIVIQEVMLEFLPVGFCGWEW